MDFVAGNGAGDWQLIDTIENVSCRPTVIGGGLPEISI